MTVPTSPDPHQLGAHGRSDLGEAEARLRRAFNVEGLMPLDWSGMIQPSVTVADATMPGFSNQRLRHWTQPATFAFSTGALALAAITALGDVIVDRIVTWGSAAGWVRVWYQGPNDPDTTGPYNTRDSIFTDRALTASELAPIARNGAGVSLPAADRALIYGTTQAVTFPSSPVELLVAPFLLMAGARLLFEAQVGTRIAQLEGRQF